MTKSQMFCGHASKVCIANSHSSEARGRIAVSVRKSAALMALPQLYYVRGAFAFREVPPLVSRLLESLSTRVAEHSDIQRDNERNDFGRTDFCKRTAAIWTVGHKPKRRALVMMTRQNNDKRRGGAVGRRLLTLVLMAALCAMLGVTALAEEVEKPDVNITKNDVMTNISNTVRFGTDNVFVISGEPKNVRCVQVMVNAGTGDNITISNDGGDWEIRRTSSSTTLTLSAKTPMTLQEINRNISLISARFSSGWYASWGDCTASIKFSSEREPRANSKSWTSTTSAKLTFKNFAIGSISKGAVGYEADTNNGTYLDDFTASEGGTVKITVPITNYGNASYVTVGYQVKESTNTSWLNVPTQVVLDRGYYYYMQYEYYMPYKGCMTEPNKVNMTIKGLKAGTSYDVRGVVITDSQSAYPQYTGAVQARYDKPAINSFNIGSISGPQLGGSQRDLSLMATFNDTNYDGVTTGSGDSAVYGPALDVSLYFTDAFTATTTTVNGQEVRVDGSRWSKIGSTERMLLQDPETDEITRTINKSWTGQTLPKKDSVAAAYKIVVTDVVSGYSAYSVSSPFVIDENPPSTPHFTAVGTDGEDIALGINPGETSTVGGGNAKVSLEVYGATDAASGLKEYQYAMYYYATADGDKIGNSTVGILSQMKDFTETNYTVNGNTAIFTNWTALALQNREKVGVTQQYSAFSVAKDGYYRVDTVAVDNAGKRSTVVTTLFRVDLSLPSTPQVTLSAWYSSVADATEAGRPTTSGVSMANSRGFLYPYDNRTYSTSKVWACLYAAPQTGKTIAYYQLSKDGGLSWETVRMADVGLSGNVPAYYETDTVDENNQSVKAYNDNYLKRLSYNAAMPVSSEEVTGYQNFLFRAVDTLGNTSLTSEAAVMRVTDDVRANSVLTHQGIEVALSMGNTSMESSDITANLKNKAAQKINAAFYGTEGSATIGAADFNPYMLVVNHTCTWESSDPGCLQMCSSGVNCPYAKYGEDYELYSPAMVNVQGISQASAQGGVNAWVEYDHTTLKSGDPGYNSTYTHPSSGVRFSDVPFGPNEKGQLVRHSDNYANSQGQVDLIYTNKACQRRTRHFVDYSTLTKNGELPYTTLLAMGYSVTNLADWKYLANDQPAKKTMTFTIDINACDFHTYEGGGFFFNTTIRQNSSGKWVISGYAVYVYQASAVYITKFNEISVESFAAGGHGFSNLYTASFPTGDGSRVLNFSIVTESTTTTVYWTTGRGTNGTNECFEALKKSIGDTAPASTTFSFEGRTVYGGVIFNKVNTPRPTINGAPITDSNCYGFGPMIQYGGHSCSSETTVIYSNISMTMNKVRKLSEVVTEPHWGSGKGKFILNITDDSVSDFEDPNLSAAIQWRLINDNARYIGWGKDDNRTQTDAFLDRIRISADVDGMSDEDKAAYLRAGMFEGTGNKSGESANAARDRQFNDIAEYISRQYYGAFGITNFDEPIAKQMQTNINGSVPVYDLDNAANISFEVTPSAYNTSTANADFPSGRWYIVHDTTGYDNVEPISRNKQYSDALDLAINRPGRYTIYFAPKEEDVRNGTLDPKNAVFNFVVNQTPMARFGGKIATGTYDGATFVGTEQAEIDAYIQRTWAKALSDGTVVTVNTPGAQYYQDADGNRVDPDAFVRDALQAEINAGTIKAIPGDTTTYVYTIDDTPVDLDKFKTDTLATAIASGTLTLANEADTVSYTYNGVPVTMESFMRPRLTQKDGSIVIKNYARDADTTGTPMASASTYTYTDAQGLSHTVPYNVGVADAQLNGLVKVQWSWDILYSITTGSGSSADMKMVTLGSSKDISSSVYPHDAEGWSTTSPNGLLIKNMITNPSYVGQGWTTLPEGAVLTVYQRATDTAGKLQVVYNEATDGTKTFAGYQYVEAGNATSRVVQQNVSTSSDVGGGKEATVAPLSSMDLSSVYMYDTAVGNTTLIDVIRRSTHPQGKDFVCSWAIPVGGEYITLEPMLNAITGCKDYYINLKKDAKGVWSGISYDATLIGGSADDQNGTIIDPRLNAVVNTVNGSSSKFGVYATGKGFNIRLQVLSGTAAEECVGGTASGGWTISQSFVNDFVNIRKVTGGEDLVLQINENIKGYENTDPDTKKAIITDKSARAIKFMVDKNPPTAQTVSVGTKVFIGTGDPTANTDYNNERVWATRTYQASSYLDVTNHDRFNRLVVGGSADNEGTLSGYAYYFYTTKLDPISKNTVEHQWYYFKKDAVTGELTKVMTAIGDANALIKVAPGASNQIVVDVTEAMMDKGVGSQSFNLATFAYDNQKGQGTYTGANQTKVTRVENIKLTRSVPLPAEIKVTNALSETVAYIDNAAAYSSAPVDSVDVAVTGKDASGKSLDFSSNTEVTIQFIPEQGKFSPATLDGDRLIRLDDGSYTEQELVDLGVIDRVGTLYYVDRFNQADVTNQAKVTFTIEKKNGVNWETYQGYKDTTINAATTIAIKENGEYRVTEHVSNGAGIISVTRQVGFSLDVTPPSNPQIEVNDRTPGQEGKYNESNWTQSVSVSISGSTDNNNDTAYYTYSLDNGATWVKLNTLNMGAQTLVLSKDGSGAGGVKVKSGEYHLRIKAVDKAGNESKIMDQIVKVDVNGPAVPAPVLSASSTVIRTYKEYIVRTSVASGAASGTIWPVDSATGKVTTDNVVSIPVDEGTKPAVSKSQIFRITPSAGYSLNDVKLGGVSVYDQVTNNGDGSYGYTASKLTQDTTLAVNFVSINSKAAARSRSVLSSVLESTGEVSRPNTRAEDGGNIGGGVEGGPYTIQYGSDEHGSVTPASGSGSGSGGSITVAAGGSETFSIVPEMGYRLSSLMVGSVEAPQEVFKDVAEEDLPKELKKQENGTDYMYTFENVGMDLVIVAEFEEVPSHAVTVTVGAHGTATAIGAWDSEAAGGAMIYHIYEGKDLSFNIVPNNKYAVKAITVDGVAQTADTGFKLSNVQASHSVNITFDVASGTASYYISATIKDVGLTSGKNMGTITPTPTKIPESMLDGEVIKIAAGDAQTITMTPKPGYHLAGVKLASQNGGGSNPVERTAGRLLDTSSGQPVWKETGTSLADLLSAGEGGSYSYTFRNTNSNMCYIEVYFAVNTYTVSTKPTEGGKLEVKWGEGTTAVQEGTVITVDEGGTLRFTAVPNAGYRLSGLTVDGTPVGAQDTWSFGGINSKHTIEAVFVKKTVAETHTAHSVVVNANNVRDNEDKLAATAYSFRVVDGKGVEYKGWSSWQVESAFTVTGLQPNTKYTVYVKVRDAVGNETTSQQTVYTLANIPSITSVTSLNSDDDSSNKSVRAAIDTNGNPKDTKYMVYYSEREDMSSDVYPGNKDWQVLSGNNTLDIGNLTAARRYFLQVRAINGDGLQTGVDEDNIKSILLTPTAPPEGSLKVTEQASPSGGVTLTWDDPKIELSGFVLYRDGVEIRSEDRNARSYTDPFAGLQGDKVYTYSYAYVNAAGVGSSRTATISDYYDANADGKKTLDALEKTLADDMIYNELLTYPSFPVGIAVLHNSPEGESNQSGKLQVQVTEAPLTMGRYGKYTLGLKAYSKNPLTGIYDVPVTDFGSAAPNYADKTTVTADAKGATATWTNLNTDYEYEVYVKAVSTTGKPVFTMKQETTTGPDGNPIVTWVKVYTEGYLGKEGGVEGTLRKTMTVTQNGYSTDYGFSGYSAYASLLKKVNVPWSAEEAMAYTKGHGWSTPMPVTGLDDGKKIKFNKSPNIELPNGAHADMVYDQDSQQVQVDSQGKPYILIDKENTLTEDASKFVIRIAAWDEDGGPVSITGVIGGVEGKTESISNVHTTREEANKVVSNSDFNYYEIIFDGRQLPAGVYNTIELSITDGQLSKKATLSSLKIVVNQALPNVYITGGNGTRKIEQDGSYKLNEILTTSTSLTANTTEQQLRTLRLEILQAKYDETFGSHVESEIITKLGNPANTAYLESAKKILGDKDYERNLNAQKNALTADGARLTIDRLQMDVVSYFEVNEQQYTQALQDGLADKLIQETVTIEGKTITRYWMETETAFGRNACNWASYNGATGSFTVTGTVGESYALRLVTHFGRNVSNLTTYFRIMEAPKITIGTHKVWEWSDVVVEEYTAAQKERVMSGGALDHVGRTVQDAFDRYSGIDIDAEVDPADYGNDTSSKAYRVVYTDGSVSTDPPAAESPAGDGTEPVAEKTIARYEVYKLIDRKTAVGKGYIAGNLTVSTGVYDNLAMVGVLVSKDGTYNPNNDNGATIDAQYKFPVTNPDRPGDTKMSNGVYSFKTSGLTADTTYYLWTYYTVADENGNQSKPVFQKDYVAITTGGDFKSATYTFDARRLNLKEASAAGSDKVPVAIQVSRLGDAGPTATLNIKTEYLEADEYGNVLTDSDGNPIPLKSTAGGATTLLLQNAGGYVSFDEATVSREVLLNLTDNGDMQGHMVVRLTLEIDYGKSKGYNYLAPTGNVVDIFVQDDESPVTTYRLGVVDDGTLKPVMDGNLLHHYEYNFPGLQLGYTTSAELTITYRNIGSGDLTDIKIDILDEEKKELSKFFMATQPPYSDCLAASTGGNAGETGTVRVMAKAGLPDGVHYAWLRLYAKDMDPRDEIWIKVCQVVGQSTLSGKVYIGTPLPDGSVTHVGESTMYLYSGTTTYRNGAFSEDPIKVVKSNSAGGGYKIQNIVNGNAYALVIEREGFITYNGVAAGRKIVIGKDSLNMRLDIRLLAGDIVGPDGSMVQDGFVDDNDYNMFLKYYNWNVDVTTPEDQLTDEQRILRRCDFNGDAFINALDWAAIRTNMNKNYLSYTYNLPTILSVG